jgi:hypothetical protein
MASTIEAAIVAYSFTDRHIGSFRLVIKSRAWRYPVPMNWLRQANLMAFDPVHGPTVFRPD